jgi:outer membrane protein assembly factor BamB
MSMNHLFGKLATALVMASISLGGVLTTSAASGTGDWPMFADGPAHDGVNRAEHILSPTTVSGLGVTHTFTNWVSLTRAGSYQTIVGGFGYSAIAGPHSSHGSIAAFRLSDGAKVWSHPIFACNSGIAPAVVDGTAFAEGNGTLHAYKATTGRSQWTTPLASPGGCYPDNPVTVTGGIVYASQFSSTTGVSVFAVNSATGAVLWSAAPSGCCETSVAISGGLAYVDTDHLTAYNAVTGAQVFSSPTSIAFAQVAISGGIAFLFNGKQLDALSAGTGALLWSASLSAPTTVGSEAVDGNTLVVTNNEYVTAFSASSGAQLWRLDSGSTNTDYQTPSIADGVVYAASYGLGIQALDEATGAVLYATSGMECINAVVSRGSVYATCLSTSRATDYAETVFGL